MNTLLLSGLFLSTGIILGRLLGFLRQILLANYLGVTSVADIAVLTLTIPDLFTNILVGSAMGAAFIPVFKQHSASDAARQFVQANLYTGTFFIVLTGLCCILVPYVVQAMAPGIDAQHTKQLYPLLNIAFWVIPLTALAGLSTAYAQAQGYFFIPALGTMIFNFFIVLGLLIFGKTDYILWVLSFSVIIGALMRWGSQLFPFILKGQFRIRGVFAKHLIDSSLCVCYVEAVASGAILVSLPAISRAFASLHEAGSVAIFNYSYALIQVPASAILSVFAVVLLPKLSQLFYKEDEKSRQYAMRLIKESLFLVYVVSLILTLNFIWFGQGIVHLIFGWGHIGQQALTEVTLLFQYGTLGLAAQGASALLITVFNAHKDTRTPFIINVLMLIVFVCCVFLLQEDYGNVAIMLSLCVAYWLNVLMLFATIYFKYQMSLSELISYQYTLRALFIGLLAFSLIILFTYRLPLSVFNTLLYLPIGGVLTTVSIVLAIPSYRVLVMRKLKGVLHLC